MKIALLQTNPTVGNVARNMLKILEGYRKAVKQGADIVIGSELQIWGYPPRDQLTVRQRVDYQITATRDLQGRIGEVGLITGVVDWNTGQYGRALVNTAVLMRNHGISARRIKSLLPTYDVFDELRYFEPVQSGPCIFDYDGRTCALLVCEEAWGGTEDPFGHKLYQHDPIDQLVGQGIEILFITNASPYFWGKGNVRYRLVSEIAERLGCIVVYANQVGGNDDLVFDGRSFAVDANGTCIAAASTFKEDIVLFDIDNPSPVEYPFDAGNFGDAYEALVLGTRDYIQKCGFEAVVIGLSGGIDSALTAAIAVDAIGPENVSGFALPSPYSSEGSVKDARALADNLGIEFYTVPIGEIYGAFEKTLTAFDWCEPGTREGDPSEENIQARIRGSLLMYLSNKSRRGKRTILLTTGNKSELAVGYCTLYGDMNGGLAVISDVPKTLVFKLAEYRNSLGAVIPINTITKPPSAELRTGQMDAQSLPPYAVLDAILEQYVERAQGVASIVAATGFDPATIRDVIGKVDRNEFKRRQAAPGLKLTTKAFGSGRRMPIAAR